MSMRSRPPRARAGSPPAVPGQPPAAPADTIRREPLRLLAAAALGTGTALLLVACGSSGGGLIPSANAGPLQSDFEAVVHEAEAGGGNCTGTEAALLKTEQDFGGLPPTVDAGLRNRLREGIAKLRSDALGLCLQPHPQPTVTTTAPRVITPTRTVPSTPTTTETTPAQTTPSTTTPSTSQGGGTAAPGGGEQAPGSEQAPGPPSAGGSPSGGGLGEAGSEGAGAGAQEGGK
jgi:hypothetical protein